MTFNNSISGSQRGADICVHFSPLLNLEPVFTLTRWFPLHRKSWQLVRTVHHQRTGEKFFFFVSLMCVFSHICNVSVFLTFHGFVPFFSMTMPVLLFLFVVMSGSGLSDLWPPVYADHSCPFSLRFVLFSVRFSVRLFCVLSIVFCIWLSFSLQSSRWSCCPVRLLSFCPGYVFRPVFYSTNATFFVELVPKQSSRHSVSTISSALFCILSWHSFYSTYY